MFQLKYAHPTGPLRLANMRLYTRHRRQHHRGRKSSVSKLNIRNLRADNSRLDDVFFVLPEALLIRWQPEVPTCSRGLGFEARVIILRQFAAHVMRSVLHEWIKIIQEPTNPCILGVGMP